MGDEHDTSNEQGNEVEVLDSRLDHDRTQNIYAKNADTDESKSEVEMSLAERHKLVARMHQTADYKRKYWEEYWDAVYERRRNCIW